MIVIAFSGKAGSGKDTAVEHLMKTHGSQLKMRRVAFADALKVELYDALCNPEDPYWQECPDLFMLPLPATKVATAADKIAWVNENKKQLGKYLQDYGERYRRGQTPFYWVRKMHETVQQDKETGVLLVSDLRYLNEYLYVKSLKGYTVRIVRDFVDESRDPSHVSETDLDKAVFDFVIDVQGGVDELVADVDTVFQVIKGLLDSATNTLEGIGNDVAFAKV